jgi:hypothetical protein
MQPVTQPSVVAIYGSFSLVKRGALAGLGTAAVLVVLPACDVPFGLGQPTTRALENGAAASLDAAKSFRVTGSYTDQSMVLGVPASSARTQPVSARVTIELEFVKPSTEHVVVSAANTKVEAIILGSDAYFRGNEFLSQHMGTDQLSRNLVKVAGNSWWRGYGSAAEIPRLPDLTTGSSFRATFLGTAATQRTDHASVDGLDAVELSGPRGDVYISANPPYRVLRVHIRNGVVVDGVTDADLRYNDFDRDFGIAAPRDVIDFSNLSTLPPVYTVVSVDTTGCASPCSVSVLLKNLGGLSPAQAPSTVTFTMTDPATGKSVGTCQAQVRPDVGYNSTTTVGCTIGGVNGAQVNSAVVTAVADNPGRA